MDKKFGGYWCEKHKKKHTELTMGYYGCKKCYDEERAKPVKPNKMAPSIGFEPTLTGLESDVLPLH